MKNNCRLTLSILTIFIATSFIETTQAAYPTEEWKRWWWSEAYLDYGIRPEYAVDIGVDSQGNAVVTGWKNQYPTSTYTVKYSSDGTTVWPYSKYSSGKPVALSIDNNDNIFVIGEAGHGSTYDNKYFVITRITPAGSRWQKSWSSEGVFDDVPAALTTDSEGNIIVTGTSWKTTDTVGKRAIATVKLNSTGVLQWASVFDDAVFGVFDYVVGVAVDSEDNIIVAGSDLGDDITRSDFLLIKYAPDGTTLWVERFNTGDWTTDVATAMAVDASGNIFVTGHTQPLGSFDLYYTTVKYAPDGTELWVNTYNGSEGQDKPKALKIDPSGDVIVSGVSSPTYGDVWVATVKYSSGGNESWVLREPYFKLSSENDFADMEVDRDGNVLIVATKEVINDKGNYLTTKIQADGSLGWMRQYSGQPSTCGRSVNIYCNHDKASAVALDQVGGIFVTGSSFSRHDYRAGNTTSYNYLTLKYSDPLGGNSPVAVDDTATVSEDDPATVINVLGNDTDIDAGTTSIDSFTQPANGAVVNNGATLTYQPNADYCNNGSAGVSTDDFTYTLTPGESVATVAVSVTCVNDAPVANDEAYDATEDLLLTVPVGTGVLDNDTDVDGDILSVLAGSVSGPSHGTLNVAPDGSFTYQGNLNYCGPDSFSYKATDDAPIDGTALDSGDPVATVSIAVACVNDLPTVTSVVPSAQTSDYSDDIGTVIITVNDVDDVSTTLAESNEPPLSAAGLLLASTGCTPVVTESPDEDGSDCTWTYDGQVLDPGDNDHAILFTASDGYGAGLVVTGTHTLTILPEEATVVLDTGNDVALQVEEDGGTSDAFSLLFTAAETVPDFAHTGSADYGNLNLMVPFMELVPVGPGGPVPGTCSFMAATNPGDGYAQVAGFECMFDEVPVNTYEVMAWVDGVSDKTRYYTGVDDAVLVIFDPSLGFTTGGGWFYWPGTADPELLACGEDGYPGDKTNFGFNMKYNKKRTNVQGNLLLMRHTVDANCEDAGRYRVKSNAFDGLSLGDGEDADGNYGWAAFGGKSVFSEPLLDGEGNYPFLVYVDDHSDEGGNQNPADEFWIQVKDKDGNVVLETNGPDSDPAGKMGEDGDDVSIENGNIIVPHSNKVGGKPRP